MRIILTGGKRGGLAARLPASGSGFGVVQGVGPRKRCLLAPGSAGRTSPWSPGPGYHRTPGSNAASFLLKSLSLSPLAPLGTAVNRVQAGSLRSSNHDSLPDGRIDFLRGGKRHVKSDFPTCFE